MSFAFLGPAVAVLASAVLIAVARRRLPPDLATRLLTLVVVSSALTIGWALVVVAFGWAISFPGVESVTGWCAVATPGHHPVGTALGVVATALLAFGTARAFRAGLVMWRSSADWRGSDPLEIVPSPRLVAFAVPTGQGSVVVSTGLVRKLTREQLDVVLAHEEAHVRLGHHRYVRAARLAAAAMPVLRPIESWVRIATERWADEEAATIVGNRRLVADALVAAAGAQVAEGGLALAGATGLEERIDALVNPRPAPRRVVQLALGAVGFATIVSVVASVLQLQTLLSFVHHVCTGA